MEGVTRKRVIRRGYMRGEIAQSFWLTRTLWLTSYQGRHSRRLLQLRHITYESHQPRRADEIVRGFPNRCLCGYRGHPYRRCCNRSRSVRGSNKDKETASAVMFEFLYKTCPCILFKSKLMPRAFTGLYTFLQPDGAWFGFILR